MFDGVRDVILDHLSDIEGVRTAKTFFILDETTHRRPVRSTAVPYELEGWGSDLGIAVSGPDPAACCAAAVQGLAASFTRARPDLDRRLIPVEIDGDTPADLLAGILEEAIVLLDSHGEVALELVDVAIGEGRLRGRFEVAALDDVDVTDAVPKAVTWHDLRLEQTAGGWAGHVVVDL